MRRAMRHLAGLGHVRCAFLAGPRGSWSNRERLRGLRAAARSLGSELVTIGPMGRAGSDFPSGAAAANQVLESGATAVLAYNDLVAVGVLSRLAELGVRVPDELSVVGFDDIPLASMVTPPLTTVAAPAELAGRTAVEALIDGMEHPAAQPAAAVRRLATTLVVRGSTAAPVVGGVPVWCGQGNFYCVPASMQVRWAAGTATPFATLTSASMSINLSNAELTTATLRSLQ